jgi:Uri superfamily endonuclease
MTLRLRIGALGEHRLPAGGYTYTGSALGPGGFSRLERHERVSTGDHDVRHWHVDYLLGHAETTLVGVERVVGSDCECAVAGALLERGESVPVPGFGASDCGCPAHLSRFATVAEAAQNAERVTEQYR